MVKSFRGVRPRIAAGAYVAQTALVLGDVEIGAESSVWFGTVVRGDVNRIRIGARTNVQDNCVLHVTGGRFPLAVGDDVSIGHGAVIHGCEIADRVLVGMGALVLDGASIGEGSVVGAGAVVAEGTIFPPRSVVLGVPARRVREASEADKERILRTAADYVQLIADYEEGP